MKLLILIASLFLVGCGQKEPTPLKPNHHMISVTGMSCSFCESYIEFEIYAIEDVEWVSANKDGKYVEYKSKRKLSREEILSSLEKAGVQAKKGSKAYILLGDE